MTKPGGPQLRKRHRLAIRAVAGATVVCAVLAFMLAREWAGERAYRRLRTTAEESIALQIEALTGVMEKYRLIPPLLSRRQDIRELFDDPGREQTESMRGLLMGVAAASGARDLVIADIAGTVLVSARGFAETATIARSGLPVAVSQRRLGRAALRLADGSRAYAFASHVPALHGPADSGMIVVFVPFGAIEANWSLASNPIFVTDSREFVFLSNRPEWVGKPWKGSEAAPGIEPLSYAADEFTRIPAQANSRFVEVERTIPILGWTMHVLVDSAPYATAMRNAGLLSALAVVLAGMIGLMLLARQEMNRSLIRREKAQSMRLERVVRDRTAELSEVNMALREEIEVRRQTERQLRETQDELVHAAKLAVIGQMSAGLTHEYNQPLAAIKTYADNAMKMIERGKIGAVPDVLARIGQMVDRMSTLSRTLLAFSRKPTTALAPAAVESIVSEALMLVDQKAKKAGVAIVTDIEPGLVAHTGPIRLSQVIVNLVGNAIDSLGGEHGSAVTDPRVTVSAARRGDRVCIEIVDNGPGIAPELRSHVFEPFFTTNPVGEGLGLGLSIVDSVVRDLQGSVRVEDPPGGIGACFVIDLPASGMEARAAE
ncbi:MAG: sensor histidine kinase [Oricola sp.]